MDKVKVYVSDGCRQCHMSLMVFRNGKMPQDLLEVINVSQDEDAATHVKEVLGFRSVPVIDAPGFEAFSGFQPDKIRNILASYV